MGRASDTQKVERLNRARTLLREFDQLSDAVEQLAQDCSISPRQAYRYLQEAHRLKEPLAVTEPKLAFTVTLAPPRDSAVLLRSRAVLPYRAARKHLGAVGE